MRSMGYLAVCDVGSFVPQLTQPVSVRFVLQKPGQTLYFRIMTAGMLLNFDLKISDALICSIWYFFSVSQKSCLRWCKVEWMCLYCNTTFYFYCKSDLISGYMRKPTLVFPDSSFADICHEMTGSHDIRCHLQKGPVMAAYNVSITCFAGNQTLQLLLTGTQSNHVLFPFWVGGRWLNFSNAKHAMVLCYVYWNIKVSFEL